MTTKPQFLVLTPADCTAILRRKHVGRLAFLNGAVVDIEPLGYVMEGSWLYFRSAHGAKLEALAHNPYVAFEVDEMQGPLDWKSVVAHGTIYVFPSDGASAKQREYQRAVKALRALMPEVLTPEDPVPERTIVYGLHIDRLDGRTARSAPRVARARAKGKVRRAPRRRRPSTGT